MIVHDVCIFVQRVLGLERAAKDPGTFLNRSELLEFVAGMPFLDPVCTATWPMSWTQDASANWR